MHYKNLRVIRKMYVCSNQTLAFSAIHCNLLSYLEFSLYAINSRNKKIWSAFESDFMMVRHIGKFSPFRPYLNLMIMKQRHTMIIFFRTDMSVNKEIVQTNSKVIHYSAPSLSSSGLGGFSRGSKPLSIS